MQEITVSVKGNEMIEIVNLMPNKRFYLKRSRIDKWECLEHVRHKREKIIGKDASEREYYENAAIDIFLGKTDIVEM